MAKIVSKTKENNINNKKPWKKLVSILLQLHCLPWEVAGGTRLQYWGTGLSLRNINLWSDSPRPVAGTSAGRRPATVGMCSLMSGSVKHHYEATGQACKQPLARASTVCSRAHTGTHLFLLHDNPDPTISIGFLI